MSKGFEIAKAAQGFVGTPFMHQGRMPGVAMDCAGVALCAAWQAGVAIADFHAYGAMPRQQTVLQQVADRCMAVDYGERAPGDLLLFTIRRVPMHFAVWDGKCIIHALEPKGGVVRHSMGTAWAGRVHSCWRFPGVSDG